MTIKQISVFVENKLGNLAEVTDVLASAGINMYAISLADTRDFGILRLIVDDSFAAAQVLKENNYIVSITPVLALELPNEPGSLHKALSVLEENNIDLKYLYDFNTVTTRNAHLVFRVEDTKKAEEVFGKAGFRMLFQEDLKG